MGKRTLKILLPVLILLLILLCGTTFALMLRRTDTLDNQFEAAVVSCAVDEAFNNNVKTSIAVKNTGNIEAYLRVRLVSYWVDSEENIVSEPSEMPKISVAENWISGADNTYYYSLPVAPNESTPDLLGGDILLKQKDGYLQVIEVFADAIQSKPGTAVTGSWGVSLDDTGKIIDS